MIRTLLVLAMTPLLAMGAPLESYAARSVARLGILDLRLQQDPTPEDYQLASLVLGIALSIDPNDADIARHRIEAAWAIADEETLIEESRRLVTLDASQTVALLRVITSRIGQLQTAEERIAMYDRFLGTQGERLDASIRSRIALDAALLHRELGQEDAFVERLNLALKLDGTNKEAAALATALYAETVGDPIGRLEMAEHLLYADPLDPNTHLSISQLLCILGDWVGAVRFHDNFYRLVSDDSTIPLDQFELQRFTMMYRTQGPGAILNYFNTMLASMRHESAAKIKALQDANLPLGDVKDPKETRLNFLYDRYRVLAAKQHPEGAALLPEAMLDYAKSVRELEAIMKDDRKRPRGMSKTEGLRIAADAIFDLQLMRLVTETQGDILASEIEALSKSGAFESYPERAAEIGAWIDFRRGNLDQALQRFEAIPNPGGMAMLGHGLALEAAGREDEAIAMLQRLSQDLPFDLLGAYAQGELIRLRGAAAVFSEYTVAARDWRLGVPSWIDEMTIDPTSFMTLDVDVEEDSLDGTGGAMLRIRLRNLAPIPLGLGANQPLNSRLLISPAVRAGIDPQIEFIRPEVVDIGRQLRLKPREAIEARVWVEPGFTGWFVETCAAHTIRMGWRAIQGFRVNANSVYVVGPLCIESGTGDVVRPQLKETRLDPETLADQITTEPEQRLARPLTALRALLLNPVPDRQLLASTEAQEGMAEVLAARYHGLGRAGRAAMLCNIPTARQVPAFDVFDQTVRHEEDPQLWALMLLTRVSDAEDIDLLAAIEDPNPLLSRIATIHRDRLLRGAKTVSGATADPRSIRPVDFHE